MPVTQEKSIIDLPFEPGIRLVFSLSGINCRSYSPFYETRGCARLVFLLIDYLAGTTNY